MALPRRTRTEFADFFRTSAASSSRHNDADATPMSDAEAPEPVKKSRIPFLGRARKKSQPSSSSSGHETITSKGRLHSARSHDTALRPSMQDDNPSPSLGSRLASHFNSSKPRLLHRSPKKGSRTGDTNVLSPPNDPSTNSPSFESRRSSDDASRNRTPTPGRQPMITVSLSPDNLAEYKDLFTRPSDEGLSRPPAPSPPLPARSPPPLPTPSTAVPRTPKARRHTRTNAGSIEELSGFESDQPLKTSTTRTSVAQKRRTLGAIPYNPSDASSTTVSRRLRSHSLLTAASPPPTVPLPAPPSGVQAQASSIPPRSSMSLLPVSTSLSVTTSALRRSSVSSMADPKARRQPSTLTPLSTPPDAAPIPPVQDRDSASQACVTIPQSPVLDAMPQSPASDTMPQSPASDTMTQTPVYPVFERDEIDINIASSGQLRAALKRRDAQLKELEEYITQLTDAHIAEKYALEKKVVSLTRESARKDKEIKGLTWLVVNNRDHRGADGNRIAERGQDKEGLMMLNPEASASTSTLDVTRGASPPMGQLSAASRSATQLVNYDSAPESSYASGGESRFSGTESWYGSSSATESTQSSFLTGKKVQHTVRRGFGALAPRHSLVARSPDAANGHAAYRLSSVFSVASTDSTRTSETPNTRSSSSKRSSMASTSSSGMSISPSAHPPMPAIPETRPMSATKPKSSNEPLRKGYYRTEKDQPEKEAKDEKRTTKRGHRVSAAPPLTPAAAYAATLNSTRSPSIAQVLERSPRPPPNT
ncbi:hypothetical protein FISHEDRAFT_73493 [Fistulina hepatica ATCC 64428]|uniref:Uncharacterized protein n=1 Tax=Fistulina hepatica ATCC 64428 TaxID=1128425 RepID=A0A0D7ACE1_9AGAR|nr:hypothetical protein FISHEDRAFT_73493 [Fistulina hepatica ATCC 64428]